ncbi:hypothetical protein L5515_002470 [Caenorhabditis briggsae]|uniref:Uncharacterized protein n=1 Tax=Caenorhabditis briggsae TaxID=6238 RepID=A0AAE9E6J3_CAEBR|nr:hypothetical protein L5515_002470 [Caenorhabditis briggsae]
MFGEYPADGFCDPTSQTWQVADETGSLRIFDKLYGACVDYETPAATEPPQLTCPCAYMDIVTSNAKEYIGHFDLYLKNLSHYDLVTPEEFIFSIRENGCVANYRCPAGTSRYFFSDFYQFEAKPSDIDFFEMRCESNHRWYVMPYNELLDFMPDFVMPVCVNFSTPLPNPDPPTSPMCSCDNYMLRASLDRTTLMNNFEVKSTVSDDHCHWEISCKNEAHAVVEVYGQKYFYPEGEVQILTTSERSYEVRAVEMFCVDEMWTVIDGSDVTQLTRSVYMTCAYFSTPSTKNLPPLETMCNCPHKMMPNYLIPDNRILEPNFFITSTISNDRCVWEIQCGYPTNLKFNANGQEFSGSWSIGICDKSTNKWDIFYQKRLTNYTLNAMPNFDFMCDYN